jgi:bifunctional non-homologous end joining protein LigD
MKTKCGMTDRFTIVGYVNDVDGALGAVRLAMPKSPDCYVGTAGTGFTRKTGMAFAIGWRRSCTRRHAFRGFAKSSTVWVEPQLEAEIDYRTVTTEGLLRHPLFKGLAEE